MLPIALEWKMFPLELGKTLALWQVVYIPYTSVPDRTRPFLVSWGCVFNLCVGAYSFVLLFNA